MFAQKQPDNILKNNHDEMHKKTFFDIIKRLLLSRLNLN
jgi:hypothetical protein